MHASHACQYSLDDRHIEIVRTMVGSKYGIVPDNTCKTSEEALVAKCLNLVFVHDPSLLSEYAQCKRTAPETTSACIVVPAALVATDTRLRECLKGMKHLCTLKEKLPRPYAIYYDRQYIPGDREQLNALDAHVKQRRQKRKYCVLYPFKINGQRSITLLDSGADENYLTERKARELGLDLVRSDKPKQIAVPGGHKATCNLQVCARLSINDWQESMTLHVIRELPGDIDMLLGMRFLAHPRVQAKWDFYAREFYFGQRDQCGASLHVLTSVDELLRAPHDHLDMKEEPTLLTATQVRRNCQEKTEAVHMPCSRARQRLNRL